MFSKKFVLLPLQFGNVYIMVFYKILFKQREKITGSMAILYSVLVAHSLLRNGEIFDGHGDFDYDAAKEFIDNATEGGKYYIDYYPLSVSYLSKTTGMTKQNIRLTLKRLYDANFIDVEDEAIYCPTSLLDDGFMRIPDDTSLRGWQLIDYAFMKERSASYEGTIDTWASVLSELLHTTKENVYMTISRLKEKGYVERQSDGRLLIK